MKILNKLSVLALRLHLLLSSEEGQDLVEYALVVALIAFGATASMKALAGGLNHAFSDTSSALSANIT
ncbi:MAG: Flp family type IVb pilin [Bryobacteraceae bacterium]|jgi:pilus assembly protein Flp/PilA